MLASIQIINDGFTLESTIPETKSRPALRYKFRPALPDAVYEYQIQSSRTQSGKERLDAVVRLLLRHLVLWDLKYPNGAGELLPITAETLGTIQPYYLGRMVDTITGYDTEAELKN